MIPICSSADPFVLKIQQSSTFRASALDSSSVTSVSQLLLRRGHAVYQGDGQMFQVTSVQVGGTPRLKVRVESGV